MSRKLATTIKDSAVPGKWKRVLEAYAAYANNDGTNIYASKTKLGWKAGASPDTIYRQTPDLLACGILKVAEAHTCRVPNCNKGATHFTGKWGHYTTAYNIDISFLQNAETYLSAKHQKVIAAKCRKVGDAICGTTQVLKETPAPASPSLGTKPDSSALTGGEVSKRASKAEILSAEEQTKQNLQWLEGEPGTEEDGEEPITINWSERHQREFSFEEAYIAVEYLLQLFPRSDLGEVDVVAMAEIALDFQARYPNPRRKDEDGYYADDIENSYAVLTMRSYLEWNRHHKKPQLQHATVAEFHRAWFSDSDRCARIQWEDHDVSVCPVCKTSGAASQAKPAEKVAAASTVLSTPVSSGFNQTCECCGKPATRYGWCEQCFNGVGGDTRTALMNIFGSGKTGFDDVEV